MKISHHLKWGLLPPNEIGRTVQQRLPKNMFLFKWERTVLRRPEIGKQLIGLKMKKKKQELSVSLILPC